MASAVLTHGCSLSNAVLFVADGLDLFAEEGLDVVVPGFDELAGTGDLLRGNASIGTAPFSAALCRALEPDPLVIVAGSGLRGLALVARRAWVEGGALAPASLGTFRGDPLELLALDVLRARQVPTERLRVRYLATMAEALAAITEGVVDLVTVAEPFAGRLASPEVVALSDGTEVWGERFPDTVLVVRRSVLAERPEMVVKVVRALLRAQRAIEEDPFAALELIGDRFPGFTTGELVEALRRQPPCVDIRDLSGWFAERWPGVIAAGLARSGPFPQGVVDLRPLTAALASLSASLSGACRERRLP